MASRALVCTHSAKIVADSCINAPHRQIELAGREGGTATMGLNQEDRGQKVCSRFAGERHVCIAWGCLVLCMR